MERDKLSSNIHNRDKVFILETIRDRFSIDPSPNDQVLDFGCGRGGLVDYLQSLGDDSYGCDISEAWKGFQGAPVDRLALISMEPYRLPYEDNFFDVVYSTSVLEHARNQEEYLAEIHRILKVGGISMHLFPGKWYLPYEPYILIPLINYCWPHCPEWWINF